MISRRKNVDNEVTLLPKTHLETSEVSDRLTIVALHGNGGGAFRFERLRPYIPGHIRFLAVTLPGFARVPPQPHLDNLAAYGAHLNTLLALEKRPLILLGHGIGGSIALELAQHDEANLDGLILHAPVGTRLDRRLFPRLMALPGARKLGQWLFSARLARPLFKRLLFSRPVPADYVDRFFEEYRHCAVFGQMFELISAAWFRGLRPVQLPTALLWGGRERLLKVDQLDDYRALFPNHLVRIVPDWGHFPMIEQPEAYAREIISLAQRGVS